MGLSLLVPPPARRALAGGGKSRPCIRCSPRRAGNIINRGAREIDLLTVTTKGPKDFVSEVDRQAESTIVETLLDAYPDHAILAEEGTAKGANADAENVWIIDPLDGTTNFLHGFPQYCVSIALAHRGQVTQGVIYDPVAARS